MNEEKEIGKSIVIRENMLITISGVALLALIIGAFRFGMVFTDFLSEQKRTTQEIARLNQALSSFRTEIMDYVDTKVAVAASKRYTSAHDEIRTAVFRQRLGTNHKDIADAYPDFAEIHALVERYSAAERATKSAPQ